MELKIRQMDKELYSLKEDYEEALSETNEFLQKYRSLEDEHRKLQMKARVLQSEVSEADEVTLEYEKCLRENHKYRNSLRAKEDEIGQLNSFIASRATESRHQPEHRHSHHHSHHKKEGRPHPKKGVRMDLWLSRQV